jgi:hypothetical protein
MKQGNDMTVNTSVKETLAKLLATENLTVVHQNVQTASFNLKDRTLILPEWDNMTAETYDHLVGHEVGHALYTPEAEWMGALEDAPAGFKSFLNVVEDARIESMIQSRFPGLRRSFITSYRKLMAEGFFGGDLEKINSMKLIDRLNVYFKCGMTAGIRIDRSEMEWVELINSARTFQDVIDIAKRLYEFEKEKRENSKQEQEELMSMESDGQGQEIELDDFDTDGMEDSEIDGEDDFSEEFEGGEDDDEEFEGSVGGYGAGAASTEDITAETVEALENNIQNEYAANSSIDRRNVFVNWDINPDNYIYRYEKVLAEISSSPYVHQFPESFKQFMKKNKKIIDYLVKEFEMKKSADNYSRAAISSTGVIDTLKMNSYKYNDDIFRKVTVVPDGKNHGLLMFVDWSGSMQNCIGNTIEQMMTLVMFCRQVNIPFRVFSFTESASYMSYAKKDIPVGNVDELSVDKELLLCELFSNKMRTPQFNQMMQYFAFLSAQFAARGTRAYYYFTSCLHMGATPLNSTIVVAKKLFDKFKADNRLDIVNMVFLTDGDSNRVEVNWEYENNTHQTSLNYGQGNLVKFIDTNTKKQYRIEPKNYFYGEINVLETKILLNMLRDNTGANIIGIRIFHTVKHELANLTNSLGIGDTDFVSESMKELTKQKFFEIPAYGYDKFFGIRNKDLMIESGEMSVDEDAKKSELRRAFGKANKNKLLSRVLLNKFIEMIC